MLPLIPKQSRAPPKSLPLHTILPAALQTPTHLAPLPLNHLPHQPQQHPFHDAQSTNQIQQRYHISLPPKSQTDHVNLHTTSSPNPPQTRLTSSFLSSSSLLSLHTHNPHSHSSTLSTYNRQTRAVDYASEALKHRTPYFTFRGIR